VPVRVTVGQTLVTVVEVSSGKVNREDVICWVAFCAMDYG
jgi:hypothetical protein